MRGFSFEGVPFVMEIYDTVLETACVLREYEGALRCVPTGSGVREYECLEGCSSPWVLGRPSTEDCGPAYWPGAENLAPGSLVRLEPVAVDDNAQLNTGVVPVAAALIDTYELDEGSGQPIDASELVAGEIVVELNTQGLGVQIWTAEDGSRLVLGPYDARYGAMSVPEDTSVLWLEPPVNSLIFFADDGCTQRLVCGSSENEDVPRLATDGVDVYLAGTSAPGEEVYFGSPEQCNGPAGPDACFEAIGPLVPATDYPAIVRDPVSNEDVTVDVLALASGERLGLAGSLQAGAQSPCVPRRVGDSFRCFSEEGLGLLEFGIGPFSVYADSECTVLAIPSGFGLVSGAPYYRPSVGTCDPGGEVFAWAGEVAAPAPFFANPAGCTPTPNSYIGPWGTYQPADADDFPALGPLEVF